MTAAALNRAWIWAVLAGAIAVIVGPAAAIFPSLLCILSAIDGATKAIIAAVARDTSGTAP
jgi:hypothetical protein